MLMEKWRKGDKIGEKYRIKEVLGSGGTGTVFQVYDERLDKIWAAKRVQKHSPITEGLMLGRLDGSLFPRIVDIVEEKDCRFIIMDWVDGETLEQRMNKRGSFSVEEAVKTGAELCKAIEALHKMRPPCLYLDCKPSNIMMDKNGKLWLIDFGSAMELGGYEAVPMSVSPGYSAPEQFHRNAEKRKVDERSDIYSIGRTLYALLTGQNLACPPYGAYRLCECRPEIPERLQEIIEKCCSSRPEKRWQTVSALRKELEDTLTEKKCVSWRRILVNAMMALSLGMTAWCAKRFFSMVQSSDVKTVQSLEALGELVLAVLFLLICEKWRTFLKEKDMPKYEEIQSVLRTEKKPGKWIFPGIITGILLGRLWMPTAVQAAENICDTIMQESVKSPVILRDSCMRKLLVREGTVLISESSVYLEITPESFETEEELEFCITATGAESGKQYRYELRYMPEGVE